MEDWKKKYEDAIIGIKAVYENADASTKAALETKFPELTESEDERIRKTLLRCCDDWEKGQFGCMAKEDVPAIRAYLEKQKEDKEELVYRLNGLMQDYIKEGKDDEEKEHRFKCYQLFWDALEDADFFEQKEQKPVEIHIDNPNIQQFDPDVKVTTSDSSASGKELLYVCNKSYNIGYRDGVNSVKPAEWSEDDEEMVSTITTALGTSRTVSHDSYLRVMDWLKSLRPQPHWKPSGEQMRCLLDCVSKAKEIHNASVGGYDAYRILVSLYDDIHKLL